MAGTGVAFVLGGELVSLLAAHSGFQLPLVGHRTSWQVAFICAGAPGLLLALLLMTIREPARAVSKGTNVDSHSESLAALIHFLKENRASLTLSLLLNAFIFQLFRSTLSANHLKIQALKLLRHLDTTTPFQYALHHRATTPPLDVSGII